MHECISPIEKRIQYHIDEHTFDGVDIRFPRHVKSKTTNRWLYCNRNSNYAKIKVSDGLKIG